VKQQIDIWFFGSTKAPNGISLALSIWKKYFNLNGNVDLNIYANDQMVISSLNNEKLLVKKIIRKFKKQVKTVLDKLVHKYIFITLFYVYIMPMWYSKNLIKKYKKSNESNILFFQDIFTPYFYFKKYPDISNPVVLTMHNSGHPLRMTIETYPNIKKNKRILSFLEKIAFDVLQRADRIVLLNKKAQEVFCLEYPAFVDKTNVVYIGIPDISTGNKISDVNEVINFISTGTIGRRKGYDLLVEAVLKLDEQTRNQIKLSIIGLGPIYQDLILFCEKNNLNNITFLGRVDDVFSLLEKSDVFILTSRDEGMPMAAVEAMRAGLALVLTNVGCMSDLVKNNKNGFICEPDADKISQSIKNIVTEKNRLKDFKLESRNIYKNNFTIERMINDYERIFSSLP
jgi:glycosyltransferase involved in cell wall biosynthesis